MRDALDLLRSGSKENIYETHFFQKMVRFQYPPSSLLPLELLSSLGLSSVGDLNRLNLLFYLLNATAMGCLARLLYRADYADGRTFREPEQLAPMALVPLSVIASRMFYPVLRAQVLGQIQIWIDLLFTLAIVFWVKREPVAVGNLHWCRMCYQTTIRIAPCMGTLAGKRFVFRSRYLYDNRARSFDFHRPLRLAKSSELP